MLSYLVFSYSRELEIANILIFSRILECCCNDDRWNNDKFMFYAFPSV